MMKTGPVVGQDRVSVSPASAEEKTTAGQRSEQSEILAEIHQRWVIKEQPFHSDVPVIGPLIAAFRHWWNSISTRWYVRPLLRQQIEFNGKVAAMFDYLVGRMEEMAEQLDRQGELLNQQGELLNWQGELLSWQENRLRQENFDRVRLGRVLAEYITEDGYELGELAQEIERLRLLAGDLARPE